MLSNLIKKSKVQKGFTIIEVMIVLAIAGLILVVVLIAIPQLQRNQSNSARQANLARMVSEISNYAGNNNGKIPEDGTELESMYERYLGDDVNTEDPTTGESTPLVFNTGFDGVVVLDDFPPQFDDADPPVPTGEGNLGVAYYQISASCDGEKVNISNVGKRNFIVVTVLEGGAIYCLDNK